MTDAIKYKRGQVWMAIDTIQYNGSVQSGSRPVVIISSDTGNTTNSTVVCLKITSKIKPLPINVVIRNENDEENTVLCNQTCTMSKSDLKSYKYTLSDEAMKRIEQAFLTSTGMEKYFDDLSNKLDSIESMIDKLSFMKENSLHILNKDKDVAETLLSKVSVIHKYLQDYINDSKTEIKRDSMSEYFNRKEFGLIKENKEEEDQEVRINTEKHKRKPSGFWTAEKISEFLEDKSSMSMDDLIKKWDFADSKSVCKMSYALKRRLDNL